MANLAIKGHATRGREVIELLEMLGGENSDNHKGYSISLYYFIKNNEINWDYKHDLPNNVICFTLEEFLEKYPFKIGDRVCFSDDSNHYLTIKRMWWNESSNDVECTFLEDAIDVSMKDLQPYKEEIMEGVYYNGEINCYHQDFDDKVRIRLGGDFEIKVENGKTYVVKKNPQYPKTYEECCNILRCNDSIKVQLYCVEHGEDILYHNFIKLIRCRNAYWKIADDWKPDWSKKSDIKYGICVNCDHTADCTRLTGNLILVFPSDEMRDIFHKNFKGLIEQCKELL